MHFLLHFFVPAVQLLHQCEVMSHLYESFHAGTSNNIWVFLWWVYIYSGALIATRRLAKSSVQDETQKHKNTQQPAWAATALTPSGFALSLHG